jgi:hypothetical protein
MFNGKIKEDGSAEITFDDKTLALSSQQLDQTLQALAELRARMPDAVPEEQPPVETVFYNPRYKVRLDKESKACLFSLRHAGFGWINFELPTQEVLNMRTLWNHVVDRMDLEPPLGLYDGPERRRAKPH